MCTLGHNMLRPSILTLFLLLPRSTFVHDSLNLYIVAAPIYLMHCMMGAQSRYTIDR